MVSQDLVFISHISAIAWQRHDQNWFSFGGRDTHSNTYGDNSTTKWIMQKSKWVMQNLTVGIVSPLLKLSLCVRPFLYSLSSSREGDDISGVLGLAIFGTQIRRTNRKIEFWNVRKYRMVEIVIFCKSTLEYVRRCIFLRINIYKY